MDANKIMKWMKRRGMNMGVSRGKGTRNRRKYCNSDQDPDLEEASKTFLSTDRVEILNKKCLK